MGSEQGKAAGALEALANPGCKWRYQANADTYETLPGSPIAYWISKSMHNAFKDGIALGDTVDVRKGMSTGENATYLRLWWEVGRSNFASEEASRETAKESKKRWFPYNKGGEYRKWYGNNDYVVNWYDDGCDLRAFDRAVLRNQDYFFKPSVTWSALSSGRIAFRFKNAGGLHDGAGASFFGSRERLLYCAGALNSEPINAIAGVLSPTLNYEIGQVASYPIIDSDEYDVTVSNLVEDNISIASSDWDAFETSWDFARHPLI